MKEKIKVIYIAGVDRSGSTLLGRILGQHKDLFYAGEIRNIWERGFIENQLCGCTKPIKECDVWQEVISDFLNKNKDFDINKIREVLEKICRIRFLPYLVLSKKFGIKNQNVQLISHTVYSLYKSIYDIVNPRYIIDSSKRAPFAFILSMHSEIDIYMLHITRDVRGVAYSLQKKKKTRPEITDTGRVEYMPAYSSFRSAVLWLANNISSEYIGKNFSKCKRIKYEDLSTNPRATLKEIFYELKIDDYDVNQIFLDKNSVNLNINHTVSGNPMRFKTGKVDLKLDEEWKKKMKTTDKLIASSIVLPLLKQYGYKLF